jgi:hypothetical protein
MEEELLQGGVANAGAVTRVGPHVLRPANEHSASIHTYLRRLRDTGFEGASLPVSIEDGRERLEFIVGDVALTPFPAWVQADDALASIASLMRKFHDASACVDTTDLTWSDEMRDPEGGAIICHNDVCLENVVFRDGRAVAIIDWDFAAPGHPEYDLAQFARMCLPVDDDVSAAHLGFTPSDKPARLRLIADAYGLDAGGRERFLDALDGTIARGGEFVRRRVEAGDPNFIAMWNDIGGRERFDRRRRWWHDHRPAFRRALAEAGIQKNPGPASADGRE